MSESDAISQLAEADFSIGNCQVIQYAPPQPGFAHLFPDNFLSQIYSKMKSSLILERTLCGMIDLSHNAICSYLSSKQFFAAIEWNPDHTDYHTLGFGFIVAWIGSPPPSPGPRSAFAAYAMFPEAWGTAESEVLTMLGLSRMFHTYQLQSMYGQRYIRNALTAKFMSRFGFRDIAILPDFLSHRNGNGLELGTCVVSHLTRADLNSYISRQLATVSNIE